MPLLGHRPTAICLSAAALALALAGCADAADGSDPVETVTVTATPTASSTASSTGQATTADPPPTPTPSTTSSTPATSTEPVPSSTPAPTADAVTGTSLLRVADLETAGISTNGVTRRVAPEPGGGTTAAAVEPISVCQEAQLGSLPDSSGGGVQVRLDTQERLLTEIATATTSPKAAARGYRELEAGIDACRRHVTRGSQDVDVSATVPVDLDDAVDKAAYVSVVDRNTGLTTFYGTVLVDARIAAIAYNGPARSEQTVPSLLVAAAKRLSAE